jgi:hypothetical protein
MFALPKPPMPFKNKSLIMNSLMAMKSLMLWRLFFTGRPGAGPGGGGGGSSQ